MNGQNALTENSSSSTTTTSRSRSKALVEETAETSNPTMSNEDDSSNLPAISFNITTTVDVVDAGLAAAAVAAQPKALLTMDAKSSLYEITTADDDAKFAYSKITVSSKNHILAAFAFSMIGTTQLLIWNFVISSFASFQQFLWPGHVFSDLVGGFEHAAALLVSIIMIKFNGLSVKLCHYTGFANILLYVLLPLIPQFFAADATFNDALQKYEITSNGGQASKILTAKALLSTISVFLGICSGLLHVQGFAFASITPYNYCGYVSIGNGIAGVVSFFAFTVFFLLFPRTPKGQIQLIWVLFVLGAFCSLIQFVSFYYLSKQSWFLQCIEISTKKRTEDTEKALRVEFGERRSFRAIFSDCWVQAWNAAFTLFVTLLMFPVTGPFGWHLNADMSNYLNGTFQILDLLLRWMPVLGGWTRLPPKLLTVVVLLRPLLIIPLFMIPMKIKGIRFLGNVWWLFVLMSIFTITNGWFVTLSAVYCPETVTHPREKEIASEIFVVFLLTFVTAGVFASQLPTIGMSR